MWLITKLHSKVCCIRAAVIGLSKGGCSLRSKRGPCNYQRAQSPPTSLRWTSVLGGWTRSGADAAPMSTVVSNIGAYLLAKYNRSSYALLLTCQRKLDKFRE